MPRELENSIAVLPFRSGKPSVQLQAELKQLRELVERQPDAALAELS